MITSIGPDKVVDAVHGGKDSGESWLDRSSTILRCTVTSPVETALRAITTTVEEKLKRKHEVSDVQKETVSSFINPIHREGEFFTTNTFLFYSSKFVIAFSRTKSCCWFFNAKHSPAF